MNSTSRPLRTVQHALIALLAVIPAVASAPSDPQLEGQYIKAPLPDATDSFGQVLAISGDTMVVAAPNEDSHPQYGPQDNSHQNSGAAYVFVRQDGLWSFQAFLKAGNAGTHAYGSGVAAWGNWIAIASPQDQPPPTNSSKGTIRFYERNWAAWEPRDVRYHADWIDISLPTTVVMEDDAAVAGASAGEDVYCAWRQGSDWSAFTKLDRPPSWGSSDRFGAALAISGDTLVVGAPHEDGGLGFGAAPGDNSVDNAGAAYVYIRSGNSWVYDAYLKAPVPDANDRFGLSVAIRGDVIAVGSPMEDGAWSGLTADQNDDSAPDSGAVYVFRRINGEWAEPEYIKDSFPGEGDQFGSALALSESFLAVSSPYEDSDGALGEIGPPNNNSSASGAVHVFDPVGYGWAFRVRLKASNLDSQDTAGRALVAYEGTLVVGAPGEASLDPLDPNDDSGQGAGAVYTYELGPPPAPVLPFCFGDGTDGVPCPCQNASAFESDEGCTNSLGYGAILSATGSTSVLTDDLQLHVAQGIPAQPGVVLQGAMPIAVPFKDGKLCMGFPTERLEVIWFDAGGDALSAASIVQGGNVSGPGVTTYYQAWYRDPGGVSPCGTNSNLSSGLRVDWM